MPAVNADPTAAREFAFEVVARLRRAGHEAFWAGGCVRDELLGRTPADYDVATSAKPEEVRNLFGRRRTLAVGAVFGVITVLGPRPAGQVEVATFRADAPYVDGRHPAGVTFCSAREDALRRDFTINGLFFDPLKSRVIDYVGGQQDLSEGVIRAIGVAAMRFEEDHLRILRAIRFSAGFGFPLEHDTRRAVEEMSHLVDLVSPERVAAELRTMFSKPGRGRAISLLIETGLIGPVFHEFHQHNASFWNASSAIIDALDEPCLPLVLAIFCQQDAAAGTRLADRLRLSNHERKLIDWLIAADAAITKATSVGSLSEQPWSTLQPWLGHASRFQLADLWRAVAATTGQGSEAAHWISSQVAKPLAELDPPELLSGHDLLALGVPAGPDIGTMLRKLRSLQLDDTISSREEAVQKIVTWLASG